MAEWVNGRWTGPVSVRGFPIERSPAEDWPWLRCPTCNCQMKVNPESKTWKCGWCFNEADTKEQLELQGDDVGFGEVR